MKAKNRNAQAIKYHEAKAKAPIAATVEYMTERGWSREDSERMAARTGRVHARIAELLKEYSR